MALQLVETTISDDFIKMRLADNRSADAATQWLEFSVPARLPF